MDAVALCMNPPAEVVDAAVTADSALGEFCGCCPNGIAAVMMLPSNGSVRMVPGCGAGQDMMSFAKASNIDMPCSKYSGPSRETTSLNRPTSGRCERITTDFWK